MLAILILTVAASLSLLLLLEPASAARHPSAPLYSSSPTQGGGGEKEDQEQKVRLGSSPPSCRNKCYQCSPCGAVQVPSLAAPAGPATTAQEAPPVVPLSNNYKPLWWKCQCRDRLYDP